jgi:putative SOS response-associated peptidase YedK
MCGRFTLDIDERFYPRFRLAGNVIAQLSDWPARYNIAPGQNTIVILPNTPDTNTFKEMRWGLVPFWAKDSKIGYKMINAKAETLIEKPAFRSAVKTRRCIIPASGFYEWQEQESGKQPIYIQAKDQAYLSLAGLYETWSDPLLGDKAPLLETFTIITTTPNQDMQGIHDRMPLILNSTELENFWLNPETKSENIAKILATLPTINLINYPVSKRVNSPAINDKSLITKL